ncbi:2821_t:CDS:2, partial [Cetraspora pellucida]
FFPDLSIDAEQNRLSNLHIIDDGSPEFTFPKVKRKLLKDLEEAKSRADKRIMVILDNWYKSHQYQELLSEFLYDGWSDDDDIQHIPINIHKNSSQRTLSKTTASPVISDTDDEASPLNKLLPEIKSIKNDVLSKDKISHKTESVSLYGNTKPKNIVKKSKNFKRRMVHSNSWPSSILTSSHTLLLTRIDRIARRILKTAVHDLLHLNVAVEIMKELQELMESQRKMAVGNADAEDLLTKLIYVFADVTRAVEAVNCPFAETHHDFSGDGGVNDLLTTGSEWSSPLPSPLLPTTPSSYSPPLLLQERRKSSLEIDGNNKSNALLSPHVYSSPLARHVTMPPITQTSKITLEQRRASANEAIFESPIMYVPPPRSSMDDNIITWNNLTKKQVDQMLHEEMNREIDFSIRLKKQQEDVDQDSKKKSKKSKPMMNFFKSLKNAFNSPTSSTSVSPTGSPTRSMIQPSPIRNAHLPRPQPLESQRSYSFDSHSHALSGRSNSLMSTKSDNNFVSGHGLTITPNFPIPHDYILCRICEEMIPSYEIVAHSETCTITTEYAIKLQECDGRLRRLIGDVTKRKAEIMERNTPYQDYYIIKDSELMEETGLKAAEIKESLNHREALRKIEKYATKLGRLVDEMEKNTIRDEDILTYGKRLLHVVEEKQETLRAYFQRLRSINTIPNTGRVLSTSASNKASTSFLSKSSSYRHKDSVPSHKRQDSTGSISNSKPLSEIDSDNAPPPPRGGKKLISLFTAVLRGGNGRSSSISSKETINSSNAAVAN